MIQTQQAELKSAHTLTPQMSNTMIPCHKLSSRVITETHVAGFVQCLLWFSAITRDQTAEQLDTFSLQLPDGQQLPLPKVVTAQVGNDPSKHTVCVYGHVDVQPAKLEDGWATDPYNLTDINGSCINEF